MVITSASKNLLINREHIIKYRSRNVCYINCKRYNIAFGDLNGFWFEKYIIIYL